MNTQRDVQKAGRGPLALFSGPTTQSINRSRQTVHSPPQISSRSWRILLVDDDENTRYLDTLLLTRAGYAVDVAQDGEEAWQALLSTRYDLLLTDHNMPRLCGLALVDRMRAAGMAIPVILSSGCLDLRHAPAYARLDLAAVVQKSYDFADLMRAVRDILPLSKNEQ